EDYRQAAIVLGEQGTSTRVDTARRAFPQYQAAMEFLADDELVSVTVSGRNYGLASNSIHFIDLTSFLASSAPTDLNIAELDQTPIPSKRLGFWEFPGTLRGKAGRTEFAFTQSAGEGVSIQVELHGRQKSVRIDDVGGQVDFLDLVTGAATSSAHRVPFIS